MSSELVIENDLNLENDNSQEVTYEEQKSFLETSLGKIINGGIDLGLRALLPDFIEDTVIEIKDSILTDGVKEGIKTAIDNVIDLGKSVVGIFTGKFESVSQINDVVKKGGLIDTVSDILDWGIDKAKENDLISDTTATIIEKGKDTILNTVNSNIENSLLSQMESVEKIDEYIENWNEYYQNQDFDNMEKEFEKMEEELEKIVPLENIITKARQVENIHNLIKNNGNNFNLSAEELALADKLI